jgi:hypothetical protein
MTPPFLFALQVAAAPTQTEWTLLDFDLTAPAPAEAPATITERCERGVGTEIVVCGRPVDDGRDRLEELTHEFDGRRLRAEAGLGGGTSIGAYAQSVELPGGLTSSRIMITFKLPF